MTYETTHQGASGFNTDPEKVRSFPQDARVLDNDGEGGDNEDVKVSARDQVLESIEEKINAQREQEIAQSIAQAGEAPAAEVIEEEQGVDEAAEAAPIEEEAPPAEVADELPAEYADDPLADFIVMDEENNTPMFVTKVDGVEKYIPLEKARQQLQKHVAAETRLQEAAAENKRLEAREARILANEQALEAKLQAQKSPPSPPPAQDVSDQDLTGEAQNLVASLFRGTEDEAVEQLAKMMSAARAPQGPQVDAAAITRQATVAARAELAQDAADTDAKKGLKKFQDSYPDIADDEALFTYADGMTDVISAEWKEEGRAFLTSEVMLEAGKRTEAWVQSMKTPAGKPAPKPNADRHARKRNLRPMPTSHSQKLAVDSTEETEQTPHDAVQEMRKARGQAG